MKKLQPHQLRTLQSLPFDMLPAGVRHRRFASPTAGQAPDFGSPAAPAVTRRHPASHLRRPDVPCDGEISGPYIHHGVPEYHPVGAQTLYIAGRNRNAVVVVYPLLRGSELRSALDIHHIARSTAAVHDEADAVIGRRTGTSSPVIIRRSRLVCSENFG